MADHDQEHATEEPLASVLDLSQPTREEARVQDGDPLAAMTVDGGTALAVAVPFLYLGGVPVAAGLGIIGTWEGWEFLRGDASQVAGWVLLGVGLLLAGSGIRANQGRARARARLAAHPDEPWRAQHDWDEEAGVPDRWHGPWSAKSERAYLHPDRWPIRPGESFPARVDLGRLEEVAEIRAEIRFVEEVLSNRHPRGGAVVIRTARARQVGTTTFPDLRRSRSLELCLPVPDAGDLVPDLLAVTPRYWELELTLRGPAGTRRMAFLAPIFPEGAGASREY